MKNKPIAVLAFGALVLIIAFNFFKSQPSSAGPEAKLIESKKLAEFNPENDVKKSLSDKDKAFYKEIYNVLQIAGNSSEESKINESLQKLSDLIVKYPDYGDLYAVRATYSLILQSGDYSSITKDLNNALNFRKSKKYINLYDSDSSIYLLKAKVDNLSKNISLELIDLQYAINIDPSDVLKSDFFGTGNIRPDEVTDSNKTSFSLSDFNDLVNSYPNDYRSYLLRGIFYASFTTFSEEYYKQSFADLNRALEINPQSAEVNSLLGELCLKTTFWTKAGTSDTSYLYGTSGGYNDQQRNKALSYFNRAIELDSTYKYAYAEAAEANLELKNYSEAIQNYAKEIGFDPSNASAFNDKALAEDDIFQYSQAIQDLTKAIKIKQSQKDSPNFNSNSLYLSYQNRADSYFKNAEYQNSIDDYSRAIGTQLASLILLMNVDEIRSIYPEFADISNQELLEGLREKFFPDMTSTDFNSSIAKNKQFDEFILSDLYVARGDVFFKKGDSKNAALDYRRAINSDKNYVLKPEQQAAVDAI